VIEQLLPPPIAAIDRFDDPPDASLFDEEEAVLGRSVDKRRREFTTARYCARAALATLGIGAVPILPGPKREPLWPADVVGSITHCAGYRAAAVARASDFATIGLDAEPNAPTPKGVLEVVALAEELDRMPALAKADDQVCWDRLLFSAKESVYKAWYPLAKRWLGFEDAAITIDPDDGTFAARILVEPPLLHGRPLTALDGRWLVRDGLLVTAIAVPTGGAVW
jgi:4'-phosphopantetheinyl transferase EntD